MATSRARCPKCGTDLWRQARGEWTLANRIVKVAPDGAVSAKCPKCAEDVPVPFVTIDPAAMATPTPTPGARLVVRVRQA